MVPTPDIVCVGSRGQKLRSSSWAPSPTTSCACVGPPRGRALLSRRADPSEDAEPKVVQTAGSSSATSACHRPCASRTWLGRATTRWWGGRSRRFSARATAWCCRGALPCGAPAGRGARPPPTCARARRRCATGWLGGAVEDPGRAWIGTGGAVGDIASAGGEPLFGRRRARVWWTSSRRPACRRSARAVQPRRRFQRVVAGDGADVRRHARAVPGARSERARGVRVARGVRGTVTQTRAREETAKRAAQRPHHLARRKYRCESSPVRYIPVRKTRILHEKLLDRRRR